MRIKITDTICLDVAGENALILYFSEKDKLQVEAASAQEKTQKREISISPQINNQVQQTAQLIQQYLAADIVDLIPSYASILVVFDLLTIDHHHLQNKIKKLLKRTNNELTNQGKLIELPVYYSLESGIDLPHIAEQAQLSVEQVIAIHQDKEYRVYAIGFAPGFAYLGEVDERIAMPRLCSPRLHIPKGAVAIADRQTAVYPAQSPGGWNIIGLCPIDMFNPKVEPYMPVSVGDSVKFVAINRQQYLDMGGSLPALPTG